MTVEKGARGPCRSPLHSRVSPRTDPHSKADAQTLGQNLLEKVIGPLFPPARHFDEALRHEDGWMVWISPGQSSPCPAPGRPGTAPPPARKTLPTPPPARLLTGDQRAARLGTHGKWGAGGKRLEVGPGPWGPFLETRGDPELLGQFPGPLSNAPSDSWGASQPEPLLWDLPGQEPAWLRPPPSDPPSSD